MLKGNKLKLQRGAAAKTEDEDRNNDGENRHHAVTVRLACENLQCFSGLWILSKDSTLCRDPAADSAVPYPTERPRSLQATDFREGDDVTACGRELSSCVKIAEAALRNKLNFQQGQRANQAGKLSGRFCFCSVAAVAIKGMYFG
jgi:hypothetical protein